MNKINYCGNCFKTFTQSPRPHTSLDTFSDFQNNSSNSQTKRTPKSPQSPFKSPIDQISSPLITINPDLPYRDPKNTLCKDCLPLFTKSPNSGLKKTTSTLHKLKKPSNLSPNQEVQHNKKRSHSTNLKRRIRPNKPEKNEKEDKDFFLSKNEDEINSVSESQSQLNLIRNTIAKDIFRDEHSFEGKTISCKIHPEKNVEYICKTERMALCSKCLYSHYKEGHQITCIKEIFKNMNTMISEMEEKVLETVKRNKENLRDSESKLESFVSNKYHLLQNIKTVKSFLVYNYMSIDKKLQKIQQTIVDESKQQEDDLNIKIKRLNFQINKNAQFLDNLEQVKQKLENRSDGHQASQKKFANHIRNVLKAGRLVNEYRTLDLSEKFKVSFDQELSQAKKKFSDLKLNLEHDTKKEIDELLKNISEINKKAGIDIEVEPLQDKISDDRIRIPRWMTKTIAEFVDEEWKIHSINMKTHFFPFSRTVYLPNNDFLVIGGLNQIVEDKPKFSDQVLKVSEVIISPFQNFFTVNESPHMKRPRGCFASVFENGCVYVLGGFNYFDKELRACERLDTQGENKWEEIAKMTYSRKNPSACSVGSKIYVFGGGNVKCEGSNTIEQYTIDKNCWNLLKYRISKKVANCISTKVSDSKILILGGSVYDSPEDIAKSPYVFMFNYVGHKSIKQIKDAPMEIFSIYPPFIKKGEDDMLYIVNEDDKNNELNIVKYSVDKFLINLR
ncbi:unnamed protein product [Moneuplotes crassus]|uniref:B box-type domain-containing protein n=3 Tax=Euplotes crassus TaxID=5936 RepID=A0AAD1Y9B3_EUPCR|nr:unnamed protein product [Moneuplotes crassus]